MGKEVDGSKLGGANGLSFVLPLAAVITKDNWLMAQDVRRQARCLSAR